MLDRSSRRFIQHFLSSYPMQSILMVFLLIGSGLAEGIGILSLLPVLELAAGTSADGGGSFAYRAVEEAVSVFSLPASLPVLLGLVVVAISVKGLFRWLAMRRVGYTVARVSADLRLRLLRHLMGAQWGYFATQSTGHFANAIGTEAQRAANAFRLACSALAGVIQVLVYAVIVVLVSWQIAVLALVIGTVITWAFSGLVDISRDAGHQEAVVRKSLVGRLTDALQGIKSVKAMGREEEVFPFLEEETRRLEQAEKQQVLAAESLQSFHEPVLALVIGVGIYAALTFGDVSFPSLLVLVFLFYRIVGRFRVLQQQYQTMVNGEAAFWSLHGQTEEAGQRQEIDTGTRAPPPLEKEIRFDHVSFGYDKEPVLRDVSFTIPAGAFASVLGRSGAGKTTLVDLIIGLYRPVSGTIRVDGVPLEEIDLKAWRRLIGYVPQDTVLYHTSVRENVSLGRGDVDEAAVRSALVGAGALDFVERFDDGLDTLVGERGARLSGGQRQRIAIARALAQEPRLLILDEATTGLDPATEAGIAATLRELHGDITVIAISHQAGLRDEADLVLEVEDDAVTVLDGSALRQALH